jgi:hypothetical protein
MVSLALDAVSDPPVSVINLSHSVSVSVMV